MMSQQPVKVRGKAPAGAKRRLRAIGVAGAVVAALAVWLVGDPMLGNDLAVEQPGGKALSVGAGEVAFFALAASLLGWAFLEVLEWLTARAALIWTAIALLVLAASFVPLLSVDASDSTKVVLGVAHLAVGAVLIPVFRRSTQPAAR
jgi:hypothetical protein